jgi:signal peptidase
MRTATLEPDTDAAVDTGAAKVTEAPDGTDSARTEHGILYYIGLGASGALLLVVIALALILIVVPKVAGATPLTVLTQSMEPLYPPGTLIYDLPVKPADIRIGDVITYQIQSGKPAVISHRVISINNPSSTSRTFILKGDNNSFADPAVVIPAQVRGRLWYSVPLLGFVNNTVNGPNRSWIVDLLAGGLFAYAAYMIISGVVSASRSRKR